MSKTHQKFNTLINEGEIQKAYDFIFSEISTDQQKVKELHEDYQASNYEIEKKLLKKSIEFREANIYANNISLGRVIYYQLKECTDEIGFFKNKINELKLILIRQPIHNVGPSMEDNYWLFQHLPSVITKAIYVLINNNNISEIHSLFQAIKDLPLQRKVINFEKMCNAFLQGFGPTNNNEEFIQWSKLQK